MGRQGDEWRQRVAPHFDFVTDYGFLPGEVEDGSFWETSYCYRSSGAVVKITRNHEFGRAEVSLIRLIGGEVPPYPIWVTAEPLHQVLLDTVLEARHSPRLEQSRLLSGLSDEKLEHQLAFWAEALREAAPDFLSGDCSAIDEAELVIRASVAEHPQKVVTWLPGDAPPDAERDEIAELREHLPPEVGIETRRYRRDP